MGTASLWYYLLLIVKSVCEYVLKRLLRLLKSEGAATRGEERGLIVACTQILTILIKRG